MTPFVEGETPPRAGMAINWICRVLCTEVEVAATVVVATDL